VGDLLLELVPREWIDDAHKVDLLDEGGVAVNGSHDALQQRVCVVLRLRLLLFLRLCLSLVNVLLALLLSLLALLGLLLLFGLLFRAVVRHLNGILGLAQEMNAHQQTATFSPNQGRNGRLFRKSLHEKKERSGATHL
jgi:hypothetical protein